MARHFYFKFVIFDSPINARFTLIFYVVFKHFSINFIIIILLFVNDCLNLFSERTQLSELYVFICRLLNF